MSKTPWGFGKDTTYFHLLRHCIIHSAVILTVGASSRNGDGQRCDVGGDTRGLLNDVVAGIRAADGHARADRDAVTHVLGGKRAGGIIAQRDVIAAQYAIEHRTAQRGSRAVVVYLVRGHRTRHGENRRRDRYPIRAAHQRVVAGQARAIAKR